MIKRSDGLGPEEKSDNFSGIVENKGTDVEKRKTKRKKKKVDKFAADVGYDARYMDDKEFEAEYGDFAVENRKPRIIVKRIAGSGVVGRFDNFDDFDDPFSDYADSGAKRVENVEGNVENVEADVEGIVENRQESGQGGGSDAKKVGNVEGRVEKVGRKAQGFVGNIDPSAGFIDAIIGLIDEYIYDFDDDSDNAGEDDEEIVEDVDEDEEDDWEAPPATDESGLSTTLYRYDLLPEKWKEIVQERGQIWESWFIEADRFSSPHPVMDDILEAEDKATEDEDLKRIRKHMDDPNQILLILEDWMTAQEKAYAELMKQSGSRFQKLMGRLALDTSEKLSEEELVELFFHIYNPYGSYRALARNTIRRFGSLNRFLTAKPSKWFTIRGMRPEMARWLIFVSFMYLIFDARRYLGITDGVKISNPREMWEYMVNRFGKAPDPSTWIILLNKEEQVIYQRELSASLDWASEENRNRILKYAKGANAHSVILLVLCGDMSAGPREYDIKHMPQITDDLASIRCRLRDLAVLGRRNRVSMHLRRLIPEQPMDVLDARKRKLYPELDKKEIVIIQPQIKLGGFIRDYFFNNGGTDPALDPGKPAL